MDITYDRSALVFRSRSDAMSNASSSRSGISSTSSRCHTPRNDVRIRDQGRCVMSGKEHGSMSILGELKVAHIIPISSPHIVSSRTRSAADRIGGSASNHDGSEIFQFGSPIDVAAASSKSPVQSILPLRQSGTFVRRICDVCQPHQPHQ
jgi:hypothetical protein